MSHASSPVPRLPSLVRLLLLALLSLMALGASAVARADPPARVGRISDVSGAVWLYDDQQGEWIQALRNRPVTGGDRISVERGARVAIQIGASTVRLDGGTEIEFADLDDARVRLQLHQGTVAMRIRGNDSAREFAVETAEGRYQPMQPGRYRVDRKDDGSFGAVAEGQLRFEARDSALELLAGQRAEFWTEGGVTHYAWVSPADDRFGEWVAREEREDDRDYAREQRRQYVSPEMTGADELDRYGQWDRHPEYGMIWYPTVVVSGWAPYRYGHWAFMGAWGWTWVDDAPWGFAPFHYGRWVSYGGRWGWCPGQVIARPVYAPALVAWIGGPNFSVGINIGGGPSVGWVPLAPREVYTPPYQVTNIYITNVNAPHRRWQPPQRQVPTGPVMYTNQGVPGGVTIVPNNVLRDRQPISNAVIRPVDPKTISTWQQQAPVSPAQAVPPPPRVVATPGGAVPAAPGATRPTPWTAPAPSRGETGRGDIADAPRGRLSTMLPALTPGTQGQSGTPTRPVAPAPQGAQVPQGAPTPQGARVPQGAPTPQGAPLPQGARVPQGAQRPQGAPSSRGGDRTIGTPPAVRPEPPGRAVPAAPTAPQAGPPATPPAVMRPLPQESRREPVAPGRREAERAAPREERAAAPPERRQTEPREQQNR